MRPGLARRLATFLAPALLACAATASAARQVTEQDIAQAHEKIVAAQQRVGAARGELDSGQRALRDAESAVAAVNRALRDVRARERAALQNVAALDAQRTALQEKLDAQREALAADVRSAWLLGRREQLRLWLSADDPQQAARITRYFDYLHQDRAERLAGYKAAQAALDAKELELAAEQQRLGRAREELQSRQQELGKAQAARRQAVATLQAEVRSRSDELQRLKNDEAQLRRLFDTVRDAYRDVAPDAVGAPIAQRRGKLRWPVPGRVATAYNAPLFDGMLRSSGIVIAAAEGAEVRAVHGGRVVYADWLQGYGLLVIIDHGDGYLTVYGHNESLRRAAGDWVREGDTVATVGTSGGQSSPGLYFELRVNGDPQDPLRWLKRP